MPFPKSLFLLCVLRHAWAETLMSMPIKPDVLNNLEPCGKFIYGRTKFLFNENLPDLVHPENHKNKIFKNCGFWTELAKGQHIYFTLQVGDESCDFHFLFNHRKPEGKSLINKDEIQFYAEYCSFQQKKLPKAAPKACNEEEIPHFIRELVTFINLPNINVDSFEPLVCYTVTKHGRTVHLTLKDKKEREFSVAMYTLMNGQVPDVTWTPADYIEKLIAEHIKVDHPATKTRVKAKKTPCDPLKVNKYLEDFITASHNIALVPTDFIVRGCTNMYFKGWIINLKLTDFKGYDFAVSMYFPLFSKQEAAILYEKPEAAEHVKNLQHVEPVNWILADEHGPTTHVETYYESSSAEPEDKKDPQILGGFNAKDDCSEYVQMFEHFLGVGSGYYNGQKGKECFVQVVRGWNVKFDLNDKGEDVHVAGYIGIDNEPPIFYTDPADYMTRVRLSEGVEKVCTAKDKRDLIKHFPSYSQAPGFIAKFAFTENIKDCKASGVRYEFTFSFNEQVCDSVIFMDGDKNSVKSTTCIREIQYL